MKRYTSFFLTGLILSFYGAFVKNYIPTSALSSLDPTKISFQETATGLTKPVLITNAGDGSGRIFIVEQIGRIRIQKNGMLLSTPFLDIQSIIKSSGSEQGLLALAFDPSYIVNGNFYVAYTAPRTGDSVGSNLVLEKFSISTNNPDLANPNSGSILLTISHPTYANHNGGTLVFGQDGYMYWSTGDGGSGGDPSNNAQNLGSLLGKILRIDVHSGSPYGIPTSNPFYTSVDPNVKKEIWAYGLRNPWRISFDLLTHDLYVGDVGQSNREEVDFQSSASVGGENYGWRVMEGSICYNPTSGCDQSGKILPVTEYDHTLGCSITGGYVYRGSNFPSLSGYYFYGDYCSGRIFSLYKDPTLGWKSVQLLDTSYSISTFGEDQQGELYLADYATGKIYNIHYQETLYTITGNAGVAGAVLNYIDGMLKTVTADGSGNYSISVPSGWSGVVTPHVSGYTFIPVSQSYSNLQSDKVNQNYVAQVCVRCVNSDTTGVFRPSNGLLYLKNSNATGFADVSINYGLGGDYPIVGDWDGNGTATIGTYRNGSFYLRNSNTPGFADFVFAFGQPGDQPVTGDWNGDGVDTIGVYHPSTGQFLLRNSNASGQADMSFYLGNVGDIGIAGDWNGDGLDTTGVFRPSNGVIFLKNTNSTGFADAELNYGLPGDQPVTGDWNGDEIDTIGVYRNGLFYLRNSNTIGFADLVFALGNPGDMPIAGDWDGIP